MLATRVIPVLLIKGEGLYKTIRFKDPRYIGDPINAIRIFNEKEVDELVLLDIEASIIKKPINFELIEKIASEAFMPVGYGGGIKSVEDAKKLFTLGIEKVIINSALLDNIELIGEIVKIYGSQSVVVSLDVKKNIWGKYDIYHKSGTVKSKFVLNDYIEKIISLGCGEIIIHSIDRDGLMKGYDMNLLSMITNSVSVPTVACGGAGSLEDLSKAVIDSNVSAVAAGSIFVYHGKHKAVLITYPAKQQLDVLFNK